MKTKLWSWLIACCAGVTVVAAAYAPGGVAYTKRVDTALLAEPQILASPVAHVSYAKRLKIEEVQRGWVRVSEGANAGWVFAGNLAEEKPSETAGLDGLPFAASEASATSAARPLLPAAEEYSGRHGLAKAAEDLVWLTQQQATITDAAVQAYLQAQKKGEFQ
jgi:hypothetical protein